MMGAVARYFSVLVERFGQGWNQFWYTPRDVYTMSVLRILTGLLALWIHLSYAPDLVRWFGPRGLASILFALLVVEEGHLASGPMLMSVVVLTVTASTLLHGLTAYPLARRYGEYAAAMEKTEAEHVHATELPPRIQHSEA